MAETHRLIRLLVEQNSPDNNARRAAELAFAECVRSDPSTAAFDLAMSASVPNHQLPVEARQACLLHLKRLVPCYWSLAFALFVGPPIKQDVKTMIRHSLVLLATSLPHSKLRSAAAYVIAQIAAADYPDEWPDLLPRLYQLALKADDPIAVAGSLAVLTDLFDDLISEEMFWEGGLGAQFLVNISALLCQAQLPLSVRVSALVLYQTVYTTLLSAEATQLDTRRDAVHKHVRDFAALLPALARDSLDASHVAQSLLLVELQVRAHLYKILSHMAGDFAKVFPADIKLLLICMLVEDFVAVSAAYMSLLVRQDASVAVAATDGASKPHAAIITHVANLLELLGILSHKLLLCDTLSADAYHAFTSSLVAAAELPAQTLADYELDFNSFVTDATGLSGTLSVRDSVLDFLSNIHERDALSVFGAANAAAGSGDWRRKEACFLVVEGLFSNENIASLARDFSVSSYLLDLSLLATRADTHAILATRLFLLIPRLMERFCALVAAGTRASVELKKMLEFALSASDPVTRGLVVSGALISVTLWKNVDGVLFTLLDPCVQDLVFLLCSLLVEDSDNDTPPVLIEAIAAAVSISTIRAHTVPVSPAHASVMELLLAISLEDPANVQLVVDATECLELFLEELDEASYLRVCDQCVPQLMQQLTSSLAGAEVEYSAELSLLLEMLSILVAQCPQTELFPHALFSFVFPATLRVILNTSDDQILQRASELFNAVILKAPQLTVQFDASKTNSGAGLEGSGTQIVLEVTSKFLSPDLSDSAAMNCGVIVTSLFEHFQAYLSDDFFMQLLQATVRRLSLAKSVVTNENLVMVFCKLVLNTSPDLVIRVLTSMTVEDESGPHNGLEVVMPIWLNTFEVTRGFDKIKQNVLALGKIFAADDPRVALLVVNGDVIPYDGDMIITRSMARSMPERYTQVPVLQKILLLLIAELAFQSQQPDPADFLPAEEADDNSDWKDMDDLGVPNYDKLRAYVDDDDAEPLHDTSIRTILVQFFKESVAKNIGHFRDHYDMLRDDEKKTLMEHVLF